MRAKYDALAVCYLFRGDQVLFIKFDKKWNLKYSPPGGKVASTETPLEAVLREFKEETGLELINPKLKILANWVDNTEGINFVFVCNEYRGEILESSVEGDLEWININDMASLDEFEMNKIFNKYLFEEGIFQGKFILDENTDVIDYNIVKI